MFDGLRDFMALGMIAIVLVALAAIGLGGYGAFELVRWLLGAV